MLGLLAMADEFFGKVELEVGESFISWLALGEFAFGRFLGLCLVPDMDWPPFIMLPIVMGACGGDPPKPCPAADDAAIA